jgi:branched-chain amino acid transport system substrate-binding protein
VIRLYPGIKEEGRTLLEYAKMVKPKRVGIIQLRHVAYDSQVREVLLPGLREIGATVDVQTFDGSDLPSVRPIAAKLKATKPDFLVVCAYYNQLPQVIGMTREQGLLEASEAIVGIGLPVAVRLGLMPAETLERIAVAAPEYTVQSEAGQEPSPAGRGFQEEFRKRYNKEADYDAAYGYDAIMLLSDAIKTVGVDPAKVAARLKNVRDYQGASGTLSIGKDGNAATKWLLGRYEKGRLKLLTAAQ